MAVGLAKLAPTESPDMDAGTLAYLGKFGYMGPQNPDSRMAAITSPGVQRKALEDFQSMAGLPVTGVLDAETKKVMALPRCGNKDRLSMGDDAKRKKRFALQGSNWRNKRITYRIQNFTPDMSYSAAATEIERAFRVWSDVSSLSFVRTYGRPDIEIVFAKGEHGDGNPFDGAGGTLAHAYFPQYGGDAHFDDSESFTFNMSSGINLFQVAAHEFGHSLGLGHSRVQQALMAPFYRGYVSGFKLHSDDIAGIQAIYGANQAATNPPPRPTVRRTVPVVTNRPTRPPTGERTTVKYPELCQISRIDAVTYLKKNDRTYMFSGDYYYRLNDYGVDRGYPRKISDGWRGLEGNIDAALHSKEPSEESVIYFFKDSRYWKFIRGRPASGYPKRIGVDGFYGLPSNLDAAFVWSGNGKVYFTKGNRYYRLSNQYGVRYEYRRVDRGYPRDLSIWDGLPSQISASLQWKNGRTYFFNMAEYRRFNDRNFRVDSGYPRSTSRWWFGCSSSAGIKQSTVVPPISGEKDNNGMMGADNEIDSNTNAATSPIMHVTQALLLTSLVALLS